MLVQARYLSSAAWHYKASQGYQAGSHTKAQPDSLPWLQAILARQRAETLSSVLYPDDRTYQGKELRLKQQHFFVSATMQVMPIAGVCLHSK